MISNGNIWKLQYFLFFIFSSWTSIPHSSFNHTSANFENKKKWIFWMSLQLSNLQEKKIFFWTLFLGHILRRARSLPSPLALLSYFAWVSCFLNFPVLFWVWHRGGEGWDICHPVYLSSLAISEKKCKTQIPF